MEYKRGLKQLAFFIVSILLLLSMIILLGLAAEWIYPSELVENKYALQEYYFSAMVVLTAILLFLARFKLGKINESVETEFLIKLEQMYGTSDCLRARILIQTLRNSVPKPSDQEIPSINSIRPVLKKSMREFREADARKFIILMNFLGTLETIAFLCNTDRISRKMVEEITGPMLEKSYDEFFEWIHFHREEIKSESYLKELETFVKTLKK